MWCEEIDADEYVEFLTRMLDAIAVKSAYFLVLCTEVIFWLW